MNPKALKYILDIEVIISEIDEILDKTDKNFFEFQKSFIYKRAIERDLEIIGEAVKKLYEIDPNYNISSKKKIIGLRNIISHAYDSVEDELLWGIIIKDIPILKKEILKLKNS
ncbi:DUF86 domain-containing protein [Flammeovirga yaeyamensis]|uniref:DUF86 domain-containing protein n=1 Tax=Flammeovirga yaeyamensis TaxID=367791 RepID=A0AAX1NE35_9BACT|nr:HepT-like ribonuclease domain-containing protein [Flammeovirga yaeyamensis]MBB3697225.1 uncharacterized protein with HEPN domain [Flammeovirga yaeyamensis]NMF33884.1 DUF86 domain-containing protein [Flammeovirga yaeyamensis]QWG04856.1 DUF86 domain-containing protein [Flammeovirga yaeyamensis]